MSCNANCSLLPAIVRVTWSWRNVRRECSPTSDINDGQRLVVWSDDSDWSCCFSNRQSSIKIKLSMATVLVQLLCRTPVWCKNNKWPFQIYENFCPLGEKTWCRRCQKCLTGWINLFPTIAIVPVSFGCLLLACQPTDGWRLTITTHLQPIRTPLIIFRAKSLKSGPPYLAHKLNNSHIAKYC